LEKLNDSMRFAERRLYLPKYGRKGISFICAVANMNLASQVKLSGKPIIEECDAGLIKIAVPYLSATNF
jgi:ligand-binding sensor protein